MNFFRIILQLTDGADVENNQQNTASVVAQRHGVAHGAGCEQLRSPQDEGQQKEKITYKRQQQTHLTSIRYQRKRYTVSRLEDKVR